MQSVNKYRRRFKESRFRDIKRRSAEPIAFDIQVSSMDKLPDIADCHVCETSGPVMVSYVNSVRDIDANTIFIPNYSYQTSGNRGFFSADDGRMSLCH